MPRGNVPTLKAIYRPEDGGGGKEGHLEDNPPWPGGGGRHFETPIFILVMITLCGPSDSPEHEILDEIPLRNWFEVFEAGAFPSICSYLKNHHQAPISFFVGS